MSSGNYKISMGRSERPHHLVVKAVQQAQPGGRVTLTVTALAAGGRGVARDSTGKAWFIEGGVPGDVVVAEPIREHARFVESRIVQLESPSPDRRAASCPIQSACGGCPWMVLDIAAQRETKLTVLRDALARLGGFDSLPPLQIQAAPASLGYRNKVELSFGRDSAGRRQLGFHRAGDPAMVEDVAACSVIDATANRVLTTIREFYLEGPGKDDRSVDSSRDARVVLRSSRSSGASLVALRGPADDFVSAAELATWVAERHPDIAGIVRLTSLPGRRGGMRSSVLHGRDWLEESLAGIRYRIPAGTFFQVNADAAELLAACVLDAVRGAGTVVDLYGGVGAFGLAIARAGSNVTIIEADPAAVAAGRDAVALNHLSRVRFMRADAMAGLADLTRRDVRPDIVVADPPRTGLRAGVAAAIARLRPTRIVLVGCDPATFARDASALRAAGYRLDAVTAVDLFPQTAHVEAVGVLART